MGKNQLLLEKATKLAGLIRREAENYNESAARWKEERIEIQEIILFGSVASGEENPEDIDLIILDNGHPSRNFAYSNDWYQYINDNLWGLFHYLGCGMKKVGEILKGTEVDLHILPIDLLTNTTIRARIKKAHKDPNFFKNAFRNAMRFDISTHEFESLTADYLVKTYGPDFIEALPDFY